MTVLGPITLDGRVIGSVDVTVGVLSKPPSGSKEQRVSAIDPAGAAGGLSGTGYSGGGYSGHGSNAPGAAYHGGPGSGSDPRGKVPLIRSEAIKHGIDPDVAVRVARSEGLTEFMGDRGTSGGAFQLHVHGGLGDQFKKETGLDPLDPQNEDATIKWTMGYLQQHPDWSPWHGARHVGIGGSTGIGFDPAALQRREDARPVSSDTGTPRAPIAGDAVTAVGGQPPAAFIFHHTGGGGNVEGVQNTLRQRGLGVEYVMDREGKIYKTGGPGASNILPGWGAGAGLNNSNIVGMEVIARDNRDVTPQQVNAAKAFINKYYPNTPVMGHGEVNPGHKEADEGMAIVNSIRSERARSAAQPDKHSALDAPTRVASLSQSTAGAEDDFARDEAFAKQRTTPDEEFKREFPGREPLLMPDRNIIPGEDMPDPTWGPGVRPVKGI